MIHTDTGQRATASSDAVDADGSYSLGVPLGMRYLPQSGIPLSPVALDSSAGAVGFIRRAVNSSAGTMDSSAGAEDSSAGAVLYI